MAYVPKKARREYIKPLWEMRKDGSKGKLVCHNCAKCNKQVNGNSPGTWFERSGENKLYRFVCSECFPVSK